MKCITLGSWNKNYLYIIVSSLSWLLYEAFNGLGYYYNTINLGDSKFNGHIYIHKLFYYLLILICSLFLLLYETKVNKTKKEENIKWSKIKLYINYYSNQKTSKKSNIFIIMILFLYVLFEFIDQIVKQFFFFGDFWMLELIIMAYLCYKMLKLKIYKHQLLAIYLVSIPFLFKTITINYKYNDNSNLLKSLFVANWWLFPISFVIFFFIMSMDSYIFINIKIIMDLNYISITKILIIYGIFGSILSALFSSISTFISCGKKNDDIYDIWDYQCLVIDNNGDRYIDSYYVYFNQDVWKDLLFTLIRGLSLFLHRFFFWKYIQNLNPIFKIFSYPLIYALEKIIVLYKINDNEQVKYSNLRYFLDFFSDITAFIGFLIYLEIIEFNFCDMNRDIRRSIVKRSENDLLQQYELDVVTLNGGEYEVHV